jgi:hypothetical protein
VDIVLDFGVITTRIKRRFLTRAEPLMLVLERVAVTMASATDVSAVYAPDAFTEPAVAVQ